MMKRIIILCLCSVLYGQKEFGKITLPLGRVQVQQAGKGDFKKAMPRMPRGAPTVFFIDGIY